MMILIRLKRWLSYLIWPEDINRLGDEGYTVINGQQLLAELAGVLGLTLKPPEKPLLNAEPFIELLISIRDQLRKAKQRQLADEITTETMIGKLSPRQADHLIQILISTRRKLREAGQWQLADEIRANLAELGIALEDTPKGTVWKRKR